MTRHEAREQAFAVIFEKSFNENATFQEIIDGAHECELVKINGFAGSLLKLVEDNFSEIDEIIELDYLVNYYTKDEISILFNSLQNNVSNSLLNIYTKEKVIDERNEILKALEDKNLTTEDREKLEEALSQIIIKLAKMK